MELQFYKARSKIFYDLMYLQTYLTKVEVGTNNLNQNKPINWVYQILLDYSQRLFQTNLSIIGQLKVECLQKQMLDQEDDIKQEQGDIWSHFFLQQGEDIDLSQNLVNLDQSQQSQFEGTQKCEIFPQEDNGTTYNSFQSANICLNRSNCSLRFTQRKVINNTKCYDQESKDIFMDIFDKESQERVAENVIDREEQQNFREVFKQKRLRGQWKKNTNIPKFIVRIFLKHFRRFAFDTENCLIQHFEKIEKMMEGRSSNNYCIADVLSLLRSADYNEQLRKRNQQILTEIIGDTLKEEVIGNKYIKDNRKSYMMAMKVYSLRCRSKHLTERVKIL